MPPERAPRPKWPRGEAYLSRIYPRFPTVDLLSRITDKYLMREHEVTPVRAGITRYMNLEEMRFAVVILFKIEGFKLSPTGFADLAHMLPQTILHLMLPHDVIVAVFGGVIRTGVDFRRPAFASGVIPRKCMIVEQSQRHKANKNEQNAC